MENKYLKGKWTVSEPLQRWAGGRADGPVRPRFIPMALSLDPNTSLWLAWVLFGHTWFPSHIHKLYTPINPPLSIWLFQAHSHHSSPFVEGKKTTSHLILPTYHILCPTVFNSHWCLAPLRAFCSVSQMESESKIGRLSSRQWGRGVKNVFVPPLPLKSLSKTGILWPGVLCP